MTNCNIVEYGGIINDTFRRNFITDVSDTKTVNKFKSDTYRTIYTYDSKDLNQANYIAPLYFDLDMDNIEENYEYLLRDLKIILNRLKFIFKLKENNIELYFSGSKGFHILIPYEIFGFEPSKEINKQYKKIASYFKSFSITKCIDTKIYDNKRLFRVPNTINSKTQLYKVPVTLRQLNSMTYTDLKEYASQPQHLNYTTNKAFNEQARISFDNLLEAINKKEREHINAKVADQYIKQKKLLPCVEYILQNGACTGCRNNTAVALANSLFQIGHKLDEVTEVLEEWNATKNEDMIPEAELNATILSAQNNAKNKMYYGCSAFRDLDVCVKGCPIYK